MFRYQIFFPASLPDLFTASPPDLPASQGPQNPWMRINSPNLILTCRLREFSGLNRYPCSLIGLQHGVQW